MAWMPSAERGRHYQRAGLRRAVTQRRRLQQFGWHLNLRGSPELRRHLAHHRRAPIDEHRDLKQAGSDFWEFHVGRALDAACVRTSPMRRWR